MKIKKCSDCFIPCINMSICNYNNEYIYKFGGENR